LRLADLPALSKIAKKHNLKFVVDNTFCPLIIRPAQFGADVVVHSCTKYISGASDLVAGVIISDKEFIEKLVDLNFGSVMLKGPVMDPRVAHELYLRLDHLPIRMQAHSRAAMNLALVLSENKIPLIYPGLESHIDNSKMKNLFQAEFGFGGMMAVDMKTPEKALHLAQLLQKEKFGLYAVSLGFSRTLLSCPSVSTSSEISEEEQIKMKLSPGLLRMSIGFVGDEKVMTERFLKCYKQCF